MNKLLHGDCLTELKKLDDNSVDLLLTDPPYGTNDKYHKSIKRGNNITSFNSIEWDNVIPFDYLNECFRIMKDDTWGVVFTDKKEITTVWNYIESAGFKPRNTFYWIKPNKAPTPASNFKSNVETCIVFTKGRTTIKWTGGGNQPNYIMLPFVIGKEWVNHPTQKPIKLMEHFIQLFSKEGDVVLDPFVGSGTTPVACIRSNRNYIGVEIDEAYVELAKERISAEINRYITAENANKVLRKFFDVTD